MSMAARKPIMSFCRAGQTMMSDLRIYRACWMLYCLIFRRLPTEDEGYSLRSRPSGLRRSRVLPIGNAIRAEILRRRPFRWFCLQPLTFRLSQWLPAEPDIAALLSDYAPPVRAWVRRGATTPVPLDLAAWGNPPGTSLILG